MEKNLTVRRLQREIEAAYKKRNEALKQRFRAEMQWRLNSSAENQARFALYDDVVRRDDSLCQALEIQVAEVGKSSRSKAWTTALMAHFAVLIRMIGLWRKQTSCQSVLGCIKPSFAKAYIVFSSLLF